MEARIHAWPALEAALASQIGGGRMGDVARLLVNAEPNPDPEVVVARARAFVEAASPYVETLIVTVLPPSPKGADMALTDWPARAQSASLWEFTRLAALDWAKRGVRVNAIALGGVPADPFAPPAEAERAAFAGCGTASVAEADIAATILGMARMRSMTGQLLRLEG